MSNRPESTQSNDTRPTGWGPVGIGKRSLPVVAGLAIG
jgi:hypothetical protein